MTSIMLPVTEDTWRKAVQTAISIASSTECVVISGGLAQERYTLARLIHHSSDRDRSPFVAIDLAAAIPLIEEVFGTRSPNKQGIFEQADRGTLFIDGIGRIPPYMIGVLTRLLDGQEIVRIGGGDGVVPVNARIIVGSDVDIAYLARTGDFPNDLFYRLNVLCIELPLVGA